MSSINLFKTNVTLPAQQEAQRLHKEALALRDSQAIHRTSSSDELGEIQVKLELAEAQTMALGWLADKVENTAKAPLQELCKETVQLIKQEKTALRDRVFLLDQIAQIEEQFAKHNTNSTFTVLGLTMVAKSIEGHLKIVEKSASKFDAERIQQLNKRLADFNTSIKDKQQKLDKRTAARNLTKKTPETQLCFATGTQYSGSPSPAACAVIAACFIRETLAGNIGAQEDELNTVISNGKIIYDVMTERSNLHLDFEDILQAHQFASFKRTGTALALQINLLDGKKAFEEMLQKLKQLQQQYNLERIGAGITARGESYALVYFPGSDSFAFFDSHGCNQLTKKPEAYVAHFPSLDAAAAFLAQRMPIPEDESLKNSIHYNSGNCVPMYLASNISSSPVAILEAPTALERKQEIVIPPAPQRKTNEQLTAGIRYLDNVVREYRENAEETALHFLDILLNEQQACIYPISDAQPRSIGDRIHFHLYFLQAKESREKIDSNDVFHGATAMRDLSNSKSTPEQRKRAAQRALIETTLIGIEDAIQAGDNTLLGEYFKILEDQKTLDKRDIPQNAGNGAHHLFGKLFERCIKAWEQDKNLPNPYQTDDFGRHAFCNTNGLKIDPKFQLAALQQLRDELKKIWAV